ncbi:MAG TPA: PQQ-binding-like beta-propeller repeat protein [Bryobacteraceae bacterium]|nr:PQQ-binding-like beta-propeller repeat protein [Bryobacteraceae bacterium]
MPKVLLSTALLSVTGSLWFLPLTAEDAAMFRGSLAHTGVYDAPGVPKLPSVKWKFQTGGRIISSPAVVNGTVYVGSADGNLYAIDSANGSLKWKFATNGMVTSSPAVSAGIVCFGSFDGSFYAVNAATGQQVWRFDTEGERRFAAKNIHGIQPEGEIMPDFWDFYLSSPAVSDGSVYFGSGDGDVYALDVSSGLVKWKFKTGNVVHASPAIANGTLFIGSFDGSFYALDTVTGKEKWRHKTGEDNVIHNQEGITSSAAVVDGVVYVGCRDSHLYFLDVETGQRIWEMFAGGGWVTNSPAVKDGKVYSGGGSDRQFHALNAKSGAHVFSLDVEGGTFASPAIAGNFLYLATFDNKIRAIDLTTNTLTWKFELNAKPADRAETASPLKPLPFYDDRVASMAKKLQSGVFLSSPVVVGNTIYIGNTDGAVYALQ